MGKQEKQSPAVKVRGLTKSFKNIQALRGVDLTVEAGEFVALLGPNGAGKTTMVEILEGIQSADGGELEIFGLNWKKNAALLRQKIGLSLQETRFMDKATVREIVHLFGSFYKLSGRESDQVLERVGLVEKADSYMVNLSGGQRQRVALATAILHNPELIILDEPTTGLDPQARRDIWAILETLRDRGVTLLLTTHYMEEAEKLCPRIVIMHSGRILADGSLTELLSQFEFQAIIEARLTRHGKLVEAGPEATRELAPLSESGRGVEMDPLPGENLFRFRVDSIPRRLPEILNFIEKNNFQVEHLDSHRANLDDLFIHLAGRHLN